MDKLGPYLLGPNDENQGIYTGDARELAEAIPNESVDLIFTDPVYDRIDDYRWLAETAARVLKPDSACLVWCGIGYKDLAIDALNRGGLSYKWDMSLFTTGMGRFVSKNLKCFKSDCLYFEKGCSSPLSFVWDVQTGITKPGYGHKWTKDEAAIINWTQSFTDSSAIVLDPFTGGGTVPAVCKMLGRRWLAFEIDSPTADDARKRVRETQPPLKMPMPEQMKFAV